MNESKNQYSDTWVDSSGEEHRVLAGIRLNYSQSGPMRLRNYVFMRDSYKCSVCESDSNLVIDHIISMKNSGTNHPDNLRVLCNPCNSRKSGLFDARNIYSKPHITNGKWAVSIDSDGVRVGALLPGRGISFVLDRETALEIALAITSIAQQEDVINAKS